MGRSQIPTLSCEALASGEACDALARASETWGFFRLTGHPLDETARRRFLQTCAGFFSLPRETKLHFERSEANPWGYYDREITRNRRDWKEIFDLAPDSLGEACNSRTPWPDAPAGFRSVMLDWYHRCEELSFTLLEALCLSLDLPRGRLHDAFRPVHSSFLRLNHYPVCENPADPAGDFPDEGHLGIGRHTDAGALTILLQDATPGLQVRRAGRWCDIDPVPGSLIVNIGDMAQVWSNDRYQAPLHRVLANAGAERYSAAFFFNPGFAADCRPLTAGPPRYRPVNWGEFRTARAAGDYADLGEEIQVSHYRIG